MTQRSNIAVIGAGMSGICAVIALKEEGLQPICFEKSGHCGGLWRYREDDTDGAPSVMKTTIINTSKEVGAISNFPPPKEFPNYMPHNLMLEYICMLANNFEVLQHVKFHQEVISVEQSNDYQVTGRWIVTAKDIKSGDVNIEIFDGVMVCTGHHVYPNIPTFPGMETFEGKILHTHSIKTNKGFEGQRVVVIGVGNSGLDAATEISSVTKQVYLSCRRGSWILPRIGLRGRPLDICLLRRSVHFLRSVLPYNLLCSVSEGLLDKRFKHSMYNIKPNHRVWSQHPAVSDTLPITLISGAVMVRKDIKRFVRNGVIFQGEEDVTEVDSVILATGYRMTFPFLSENVIRIVDNRVNLYKYMYLPDLLHPTLVFIGLIQPFGSVFPLSEMQSRWATMVMCGKCSLPSQGNMWKSIKKMERSNRKKFVNSSRHTVEVDFIGYLDGLAVRIEAKPNLWRMALVDPKLFWACLTGPCLPYQYRLQGPHPWAGAREAILRYKERQLAPFVSSVKGAIYHI